MILANVALTAQTAGSGSVLSGVVLVGFFVLLGVGGMIILALTVRSRNS